MNNKRVNIIHSKNSALQFKIEVQDISPVIWRRILTPSDYKFQDLHLAIQESIGWSDSHPHHFEIKEKGGKGRIRIGEPDPDGFDEFGDVIPEWETPLLKFFSELGSTAEYFYDYGDSWRLTVKFEGYILKEAKGVYPACIDGERAGPPEDCGGVPGYYNLVETLKGDKDDRYDEIIEWLGEDWDPEKFDKSSIQFNY